MPDPLREAIARALRERDLDGRPFEICAVDLLHDAWYPDLRGTPHGRDVGVDGISGPDADPDFVLAATTDKDYGRNLERSAERYLGAGEPCRTFVLATTREVTVESRRRLAKKLGQLGVRLLAVHDRGDFERLLYRSPPWRKKLLGVTGAAPALSRFPVRSRPAFPIRPIGREADLERLRAAEGDLVLTGKPGAGKTSLLERLADEGWCLFDAGRDTGELADAVREMRPRRVALDDAHLDPGRLARVLHLRREMDADFRIVAVSWHGQAHEVAAPLPDVESIDIGELERDRIVGIIEAAGVAGPPDLQRVIADQARGLPGLAVALARACVSGRVREAASGGALFADLVRWYERALGGESLQALGALALAGDRGATTEQAGGILGMDLARAGNLIRGLAAGGTIDEAAGRRLVQPEALRYALVGKVFFGDAGSLDAFRAVGQLDDPSITAIPLIGAALRGARVDRGRLQELVDWADRRAAAAYACLGADELRTALDRAPAHRTSIAEAAYKANVGPRYALRALMEQEAEGGAANRPLSIVGDHLAHPRTGLAARRLAVKAATEWIDEGGDVRVGLRVLFQAADPELRDISVGPGSAMQWIDRRGVLPAGRIEEAARAWDAIVGIAGRDPGAIPTSPSAMSSTSSGAGRIRDRPPCRTRKRPRRCTASPSAWSGSWPPSSGNAPACCTACASTRSEASSTSRIEVPDRFAELFPGWESALENGGGEAFVRQAEELAKRPSAEVAERLMFVEREERLARPTGPGAAQMLAREIAARGERLEEILEELGRRGADSVLLGRFLDRAAELRRPGWEATAGRLIEREATSAMAIRTALVRPAGAGLKRFAIRRAAPRLIESLVGADALDHATLALLFEEPDSDVARTAAFALPEQRLAGLPPRLRDRWREIVVGSPPEGHLVRWNESLARILERDRDLCADWTRAWFGRLREHGSEAYEPPGIEIERAVGGLPVDVRAELIADVPAEALSGVIRCLVSGDVAAAEALFARTDLERLHYCALAGGPEDLGEAWMKRALLAMGRGWEPERIAESLLYGGTRWVGDESEHWRRYAEAFERLLPAPGQPDADRRKRIADAGMAHFGKLRADAARRERDERVYGRRGR